LKDTDLLNLLINKTVTIAVEKGIIRSKSIIVNATNSISRSNPFLVIEILRERSKLLRKQYKFLTTNSKNKSPFKKQAITKKKQNIDTK
jgi:hypothetical protein